MRLVKHPGVALVTPDAHTHAQHAPSATRMSQSGHETAYRSISHGILRVRGFVKKYHKKPMVCVY